MKRYLDPAAIGAAVALLLAIAFATTTSFSLSCDEVRRETLRLHIIANSNDEIDQQNKLLVRDALLERYSMLLSGGNINEAISFADFLKSDIEKTAKLVLNRQGDYSKVVVTVEPMFFQTREYEQGIILPAGNYYALRVVIGEGAGENWWCVMYPPLCLPMVAQQEEISLDAQKTQQDITALSAQPYYKARFAVVELFEKLTKKS